MSVGAAQRSSRSRRRARARRTASRLRRYTSRHWRRTQAARHRTRARACSLSRRARMMDARGTAWKSRRGSRAPCATRAQSDRPRRDRSSEGIASMSLCDKSEFLDLERYWLRHDSYAQDIQIVYKQIYHTTWLPLMYRIPTLRAITHVPASCSSTSVSTLFESHHSPHSARPKKDGSSSQSTCRCISALSCNWAMHVSHTPRAALSMESAHDSRGSSRIPYPVNLSYMS